MELERYKAPQPSPRISEKRLQELLNIFLHNPEEIERLWRASNKPYYGWRDFEMRYRGGLLKLDVSKEIKTHEAWFLLQTRRRFSDRTKAPFLDTNKKAFYWSKPSTYEPYLRLFDMELGGNTESTLLGGYADNRERFLRQSLIEESIASSQLEGATTSREVAKKMIAENRNPRDKSEWMIFNNFKTIQRIEEETANLPVSKELLLELQKTLTQNTFDEKDKHKIGRWRKDTDGIAVIVQEGQNEYISHVPPTENEIPDLLDSFISYANSPPETNAGFTHPIVKAIVLHFWFAYIHPFADGNGRMARMLFYWYLMKNGYWLIKYVPISTVIKNSRTQYSNAFVFSEQYENDLTYFIAYNFDKLKQALDMFNEHIERVKKKSQSIDTLLNDRDLNDRQKQVLHYLGGNKGDTITAKRHANFQGVSWITASKDLKSLFDKGYIVTEKRGREVFYNASDKFLGLFNH
ncbi:MAG TPA: Fic family protein [Candidatus Limnocylindria bacterium]|nr:Fic family protein [Candidatus Limnocylindria bacterium]